MMNAPVRSTCPYCGVGCGVLLRQMADGTVRVDGDPDHPANRGRLCVKGSALGETLGLDGRLLHPEVRGQRVSWDTALDTVARGFAETIARHGPESVALYVSGQLLTEDYYVANKFMKGGVGTANIDSNSRLCMSSAVAGHRRAFGADIVPCEYADIEIADLVVITGANMAWCHPVLFQRLVRAKEQRPGLKIVVIDPRQTATSEIADMHLPLRAGSDVMLFNGLLAYLWRAGCAEPAFLDAHVSGLQETLDVALAEAGILEDVAHACGIMPALLAAFYQLFADTPRVLTLFSQGVNQSSAGTDKVNALINCHLLTGRIGQPGMGPFSLTGQPNAMGGREVGALANLLAAHLDLASAEDRALLQDFWRVPVIASKPGLKAVDMFDAVAEKRIRAIWIMATNPVVSLPDADHAARALAHCEFVVVSDCMRNTDTTTYAHVLLPAAAWGEKNGTVTNSERVISRQRAFLPLPGEARPDWWIVSRVAQRLGWGGFDFNAPHEIFDEHARLSAYANHGARLFNLGALGGLNAEQYDALDSVQWPVQGSIAAQENLRTRPFADGRYLHADGRARMIPLPYRAPRHAPDPEFPLTLNTGRVRDQWHTMTRTGKAPTLAVHIAEPYVEMHAADALACGAREGELARVTTRWGSLVARVRTGGMRRGDVFVPIHWNDTTASDARVGALANPVVDPISGEPEFKHTPARVEAFSADWYGFILTRDSVALDAFAWWSKAQRRHCTQYEFAGRGTLGWSEYARALFGAQDDADWIELYDAAAGDYRAAWLERGALRAAIHVARRPEGLAPRDWLAECFGVEMLEMPARRGLLAGRLAGSADAGAIVCSCFGVGRKTILAAARRLKLTEPAQITRELKAGSNCGSCVPEIRKLLAEVKRENDNGNVGQAA